VCLLADSKHYTVVIRPDKNKFVITPLERGTSYHAYLEAILDKNIPYQDTNVLKTWILIAVTKGIGPDYRMLVYLTSSSSLPLLS